MMLHAGWFFFFPTVHQVDELFEDAVAITEEGKYPEALTLLHEVQRLMELDIVNYSDAFQADVHGQMGICHQSSGNLLRARRCYEQAIIMDHTAHACMGNLAMVLAEMNEINEAIQQLSQAIRICENQGLTSDLNRYKDMRNRLSNYQN